MKWLASAAAAAFVLALAPLSAQAATPCESLAAKALPNARVDMARAVPAGDFTQPNGRKLAALPTFCRVAATLTPSADSDIKIEVWLPAQEWNGKFEAVGNGGWAGTISYDAMAEALRHGYATASTDTGHSTPGGAFVWGHPEKLVDYSWRSEHEMALKAKALIDAYYGTGPKRSYWNGCSTGGKQAFIEAVRFPDDFDGLVAGDPANLQGNRNTWQISVINQIRKADGIIDKAQLAFLHKAVLDACDSLDGVKDGLIENPKLCHFDPAVLTCKAGQTGQCLTPGQVAAARILTGPGMVRGKVYNPGLEPGSEIGWTLWTSATPDPQQSDMFKYVIYKDPNYDWTKMDPDAALEPAIAATEEGSARAKDMARFYAKGGKVIVYQGWADPTVAPQATLNFYQDMLKAAPQAPSQTRMFLVPGMGHCRGGAGATDRFDPVSALDGWVEQGRPPAMILAANVAAGQTTRTRPLCPYPQVARYDGKGDSDKAASFTCKAP